MVIGIVGDGSVLEIAAAAGKINIEDINARIDVYPLILLSLFIKLLF